MKDKDVLFYSDSGNRSRIAIEYVVKRGIKATMIPPEELDKYEKEGKK
ncbi:MAG: hypothetical protein O2U62_01570 [Candidatus Bathyarchaeota archaeon]|nr:hypothetical protein [Candidatus Bathyarchaeota archaeon]